METAVLKTMAGFLNTRGGRLIVGVRDDGTPLGIEADQFESEDKWGCTWLTSSTAGWDPKRWPLYTFDSMNMRTDGL